MMSKFTVERSIRHRCKTYRISASGSSVRDVIKSLDVEIAALRRSPCDEEPAPVVLVDDIPRKKRDTPAPMEPGVYRAVVDEAKIEDHPARIDRTLHLVFELVDTSLNRLNRFIRDVIPDAFGNRDAQRRLANLVQCCGISPTNYKGARELIGRYTGIRIDQKGRVAAYRPVVVGKR